MKVKLNSYEEYLTNTFNDIISTAEPKNFDLYSDEELSKLDTYDKHFEYDLHQIGNNSKVALESTEIISKTLLYQMTLQQILKFFEDHPNV